MKKYKSLSILFLIIFLWLVFLFTFTNNIKANSNGFSVTPILSKNLYNKGYFDYNILPAQKKTIKVKLKNHSNHKIKVNTFINDAHNGNGIITYNHYIKDSYKRDNPTLNSMVIGNKKVTTILKAHDSKIVSFDLKIPDEGFSGTILGGISSKSKNYKTKNNTMFSTSIVLRSDAIEDNINLDNFFVRNLKANQDSMKFQLVNNQASILSNYKLKIQLFNSSDERILNQSKNYSIVPNSFSSDGFYNLNLAPGVYKLTITIFNKDNYKKITKSFVINNLKKPTYEKISHLLMVILVVIITIIYFIVVHLVRVKRNNF